LVNDCEVNGKWPKEDVEASHLSF